MFFINSILFFQQFSNVIFVDMVLE